MTNNMDIDNLIDYWLKGIPYVWIPNKDVNACQRYYLLSKNTALFSFDNRGNSFTLNRKAIKRETVPGLTFSFFKFTSEQCKTVRNYFLIWTHSIASIKHEIRIEGKPTTIRKRISTTKANVILGNVVYKKIEILKHPSKYSVMLVELDEEIICN